MFNLVISFLAACLVVLALSRLISRWLVFILGNRWYAWLLWPGVFIHEISHLLGAIITFTPVKGISLLPKAGRAGQVELGSVTHEATSNPFKLIIISFFPLIGGTVILWLITYWLTGIQAAAVPQFSLIDGSVNSWLSYFSQWFSFMAAAVKSLNLADWSGWLFLYLVLVLGAHLAPSNQDLTYTVAGVTIFALLAVILSVIDWLASQNFTIILLTLLAKALNILVPFLSYIMAWLFMLAVIIGLIALVVRLNRQTFWQ